MSRIAGDPGPDRVRDPHDSVLQQLFGVGLTLQSTLTSITDPAVRERVRYTVGVLDDVIDELRSLLHARREREPGASHHGHHIADAGPSALSAAVPEPQE